MPNAVKYDAFDEFVFDERWQYDPPPVPPGVGGCERFRDAGQDIFNTLFKKRVEYEESAPTGVKQYIDTLRETEEYRELRNTTVMRAGPAYEAARRLFQDYVAQADKSQGNEDRQRARIRSRYEMRGAIEAADQYEELENLVGLGPGQGDGEGPTSEDKIRLMRSFLRNTELMRVMRLAGRMVNLADSAYQTETTRGVDKLVGIETGDNLNQMLPGELWMLEEPEFFLLKFSQKELTQYQYAATKTKGLGPIVVCVDKSGSMSGDNLDYARAFLFGMAHLADKQRRVLHVILFNSSAEAPYTFKLLSKFTEWITTIRATGGTNFNNPLNSALSLIRTQEKTADIVFITDGEADVSQPVAEAINTMREQSKLKVFGICVGASSSALAPISSEVVELQKLLASGVITDEARDAASNIYKGVLK
jgi:uncharacterized protein with von Willebrand factor type A (vWA) domain